MKAHPLFEIWRPDEVAECLEGVDDSLGRKLWEFVEEYKAPRPEVSEEPCVGLDALVEFWSRLEPRDQRTLNVLAIRHERKYK